MIRPYVTLSAAMSIDGYLDSTGPGRLALSNAADFDRVDRVRAEHDAIMVGASTVRRDDPRLLVRSDRRRMQRVIAGLPATPAKVTVTSSGDLSPAAAFFTAGESTRLVYTPADRAPGLRRTLGDAATVIGIPAPGLLPALLDDLAVNRGIGRLMVEGGGRLLTQFLAGDLADELHLVIAPLFVGEADAPRVVGPAAFPWTAARRAPLLDTTRIGDVVLLRYALSERAAVHAPEPPAESPRFAAAAR
jgi:5-amino-6-(5-phosphoribosylamino)uracil reductase